MTHLPSSRPSGLNFRLPDDWTPQQALAVVELLDDLRERIYDHYLLSIQDLLREERGPDPPPHRLAAPGDDPF